MLISMNWISDFVDLSGLDKEELIKRFTLSTAEVEEIIIKGEDLKNIVAGKILSIEDHPNSKKLHLLKVDGGDKVYDVVCGAPNVRVDMVVPFAKEGGKAGGMDITKATIAGYDSYGMCCSASELGISADHDGLMELPQDTPIGTDITELYEIKDIVFEVDNKSLTNRPDLWGHYGIAREFATITGRELKEPKKMDLSAFEGLAPVEIDVHDKENCFRYSGLKVDNVTVKKAPVNMQIRLFYCGTRAINLLADLTNYLMLEMGQPMHAFDCGKVDCIEVKRFEKPFTFKTLDGEERVIDENTLMITSKGAPVAVAGIMGGLESEIEDDTTSLLLESANFDAVSVRKSSSRLGLRTDASMRYEKTLDPEMTVDAIKRFVYLLTEIDSGVKIVSALSDVYVKHYPVISLSFDKAYVDRYTGIDIKSDEIMKTLTGLGFKVSAENNVFNLTVPSWRSTKDVTLKADIIEEITRIYGYDNFNITTTLSPVAPVRRTEENLADNFVKDILVQHYNMHETDSYLWCDSKKYREIGIEVEKNVRLMNAMTPEHDTIRNSIVPSLLVFAHENRSYAQEYGIFEIGRVAEGFKEDSSCDEHKKLGIVLFSRTNTEKELYFKMLEILTVLFTEVKHVQPTFKKCEPNHPWQHPVNTAEILADDKAFGFVSTLHPVCGGKMDKKAAIVTAQVDMGDFAKMTTGDIWYQEPSKYPGIDIDLSLNIQPDTKFADLVPAWDIPDMPLKNVQLIDRFEAEGQKSITLRYVFSANDRTLSMEELQPYTDQILKNLSAMHVTLKM
jgi:phenylalanyl-tRNA synthetase, beta subunit, non-spirochete bacterial